MARKRWNNYWEIAPDPKVIRVPVERKVITTNVIIDRICSRENPAEKCEAALLGLSEKAKEKTDKIVFSFIYFIDRELAVMLALLFMPCCFM